MAEIKTLYENEKIKDYLNTLSGLRENGVNKVIDMRQAIVAAKKNPMIPFAEKPKLIADYKEQIEDAKIVAAKNKDEDKKLTKEALVYANSVAFEYIAAVEKEQNKLIAEAKSEYVAAVTKIKSEGKIRISSAKTPADKKTAEYELKSALFDAKNHVQTKIERCRDAKKQAFTDHVQINRSLRNERSNFIEDFQLGIKNYINNFKLSKFFLDNGLYIAILIFFIVCIIVAPAIKAGNLLTLPNIFTILEQSSTRMFYALGVAGLILLAGTDLSVGRMVALGSVVTGLILHPGTNIVKFFNVVINGEELVVLFLGNLM